jgi:hypothetical protein
MIDLTGEEPKIKISLTDCPGEKINATSLAAFLVGQLSDDTYFKQAPFFGNG